MFAEAVAGTAALAVEIAAAVLAFATKFAADQTGTADQQLVDQTAAVVINWLNCGSNSLLLLAKSTTP